MNETVTANLIRSGVTLILAAVLYGLLIRYGYRLVERYAAKQAEKETGARILTLWKVMRRVILLIFIFTTVLVLFGVWGISVVPFLALGTVLAAAIGFGAQDLVKDIIAGFFMLLEDQFHLGDTITIAGVTGTVEDIQLRVTVLRDLQGNEIFVPNGQVTVTSNYTSHFARPVIDVGVAYDTDVDHAMAVLLDELNRLAADQEWSEKISGDCEILGVNELGDSAVVLRARLTTDADERWSVRREALRRVKKRFDAEGITIPFPQVTVHRAD